MFYDGGGGRGRAIGLAQDFPVHDDKIVSVFLERSPVVLISLRIVTCQ